MLNVDVKIISKLLAERLKKVLPSLISDNQTAYINGRFISEGGRLISDLLEISDIFNLKGLLLTIDIQKAFDSINHQFLISVLKKYGFGSTYIKWIQTLLNNQESCVINGGDTTKYFKLERGTRQGDPISAYLFILVLEVVFMMIKENKNINGLNLFENTFLYTAYADDTTLFLKDMKSVTEVMKVFEKFSNYSGLKPNTKKCEIAGIGVLKGVHLELCGMECLDLTKSSIKVLGVHFSYNKIIQCEKNFIMHVKKIENILRIWRMRNLTLQGKITVFKSLAISKVVHLALVTTFPSDILNHLNKIQKDFLWYQKNPKIKHSTLRNIYENGGLKNVDIDYKITSLQCSWIKRLFDNSTHSWKIIPKHLISVYLGKNFTFHSNLSINESKLKKFPTYYRDLFSKWQKHYSCQPTLPSLVASESLWYNEKIKVDNNSIYYDSFSENGINYVGQLFDNYQHTLKSWSQVKDEFHMEEKHRFTFYQIVHSLPKKWKQILINYTDNIDNLVFYDHHILSKNQIYCLSKLRSNTLYEILICNNALKPSSQLYFEQLLPNIASEDWKKIYLLPRKVTLDTNLRIFQYKILHNVLYLNKMLYKFKKIDSPLCSFCNADDETPLHLFFSCSESKRLWNQLCNLLSHDLHLPHLMPQSSIFGYYENEYQHSLLINHVILIFKFYIYNARKRRKLVFQSLINTIKNVKEIEKNTTTNYLKFQFKWRPIENILI